MPETLDLDRRDISNGEKALEDRIFLGHWRIVLLGTLAFMAATVATYTGLYLTTYAITTLHFPSSTALGTAIVVGVCSVTAAPVGGLLSDRYGNQVVASTSRLITVLLAYPIFLAITIYPTPLVLYIMAAVLTWANTPGTSASLVIISELFPRSSRGFGLAITYALGISVFGGTTQFVIAWMVGRTGNALSPAWYVMVTGVIGYFALQMLAGARRHAP
jgi:predicted MFS family arabinose efflux permease